MKEIMKLADAYASVSSEFDALDFPMTDDLVIRDKSRADLHTAVDALIAERDALAAKLAEIEGQAPIAYGWFGSDGHIRDCISPETHEVIEGQYDAPLYLAPGANPDKQDAERYRTVLGMSNEKLLQLYNTRFDLREQFIDAAIEGAKK